MPRPEPLPPSPSLPAPDAAPLHLRALSAMAAVYAADTAAVRARLPVPALQPLQWRPGRCLAGVVAVRYFDGDLGAYDELALVLPVGRGPHPRLQALRALLQGRFEAFIWQMPVSTERAREGGVRWAGFPKWVADLRWTEEVRDGAAWWRCSLFEAGDAAADARTGTDAGSGAPVLSLACRAAPGHGPARELSLLSHTLLQGRPVVSELRLRQVRWAEHPGPGGARLALGTGPLADALRGLRLGPRPLWSQVVPQGEGWLLPPRALGSD